jgi:hypothetical protein
VAVVDLGALAVIRRLPLGAAPSSILAHPSEPFVGQAAAFHVAVARRGRLGGGRKRNSCLGSKRSLFVANPKADDVTIIDIDTQRVIAVAANDQYALVLNRASGDRAIIRLGAVRRSAPLLTMIPVGSRPVAAAVREP